MGKYSIKELEQLSGIKAHTIRIWEKRHKIISPERTPTNIRFYSDDDLKKIINVSLLNSQGFKISKIARLSVDEINRTILDLSDTMFQPDIHIDRLVVAMVDIDEEQFEKIISSLITKIGFEKTITEVVYPFMEKIGVLWQTGSITPAHEHFMSNLIRQKLISAIASLPIRSKRSKKVMLFLPEGEMHEIGLLFFHYLARAKGFKTFYFGQSLPHEDLKKVYEIHNPDILITSLISSLSPKGLEKYLERLSNDFPLAIILVSGLRLRNTAFRNPKNIKPFHKATELPALLDSI
jgi:DNA-binding transcriptional MerR regulator